MSHTRRVLVFVALIALPLGAAGAQLPAATTPPTAAQLAVRVDSVVRHDILPRGFPSVSVVVMRGGRTLLDRSWGVADVATGRRADSSTTYNIGSMAKQFTAALVLRLVEQGKLSLTDSLGRYLKAARPEWNAITIEQLLNHTSGLRREFGQVGREADSVSTDTLVAMAAQDVPAAEPGSTFAYSNTGYMLLGALIEAVHGKPYAVVLQDEIAQPLGLTSLGRCGTPAQARAAAGYLRTSVGTTIPRGDVHPSQSLGFSAICATAGDIARWNHALHGGRVLAPASYVAMITSRGAATGRYGFGLVPRKAPWGAPAIGHDGEDDGFSSHNAWYPADSLSVTLLYNALPRHEVNMADFVGTIAVGGSPPPIPPLPAIELPIAATQGAGRPKFVGAYELTVGRVFIVTFEDGTLYLTPPRGDAQQLFPKSGTTYAMGGAGSTTTVTFNVDSDGAVTGFTARSDEGERELRKVK